MTSTRFEDCRNARYWPATISRLNDDGTVHLKYDDGAYWNGAPRSVLK